jgi:transcriptional regulator with PAS, ATPase and Fis domain
MIKAGQFREDLYYRLSVFPIQVPPLRERVHDIPEISQYLLAQLSQRDEQQYSITKPALIKLLKHTWPGNIRELKNCLQLACSLCTDQHITETDITYITQKSQEIEYTQPLKSHSHNNKNPLIQMEYEVINTLSTKYQGNRKLMAAEMDISERTLYRKLKRLELN